MSLCPSCNKFCSFDTSGEPEVSLEIAWVNYTSTTNDKGEEVEDKDSATVDIGGTVRICLTSECCGEEMKEYNFDVGDIDNTNIESIYRKAGCECNFDTDLVIEAMHSEITERQETYSQKVTKRGPNKGQVVRKPIPSRYQKKFYGYVVEFVITCGCCSGESNLVEGAVSDEVRASDMDEMN